MSNNVLFKDTLRTIGRTRSRFFSIVLIVALGISFFVGFSSTAPFMRASIWDYYKLANASDIRIISTIGLTEEDIKTIASIDGVEACEGEHFVDGVALIDGAAITDIDGSRMSVRAYGFDVNKAVAQYTNNADDKSYINRPQLIEGNWPQAADECLVDESKLSTPKEFKIGSTLTIEGDGSDISSSIENTEYKIVGIIRTPLYISYERGNTTIGTGKLGTFVYIPGENFKLDCFSSVSVTISGARDLDPYSDEYEAFVKRYVDYIESFSAERANKRAATLIKTYSKKVADSEIEYAEKKAEVEQMIADGEAQVAEILDLAQNGDAKLAEYKATYNEKAQEASEKISDSKIEHSDGYTEYEQKLKEYTDAKSLVAKYEGADVSYRTSLSEYNVAVTAVNTLSSTVDYLEKLVATTRASVDQLNSDQKTTVGDIVNRFESSGLVGNEVDEIIANIKSLTAVGTAQEISAYMEPELQTLEEQLIVTRRQLYDAKTELAEKKAELDKAKDLLEKLDEVKASLAEAEVKLETARQALSSAGYEIQFGELEALTQLSDLKNQINNYETAVALAKTKVDTIEQEFEEQKKSAEDHLRRAENSLNDAKEFLLSLEEAKWIVGDRNEALEGFTAYGQACIRTAALAIVFPWFFFLVAALVSLNTMTRMIDDERTQLGTLKALGFKDSEIRKKYIFYALCASGIGAIAGSLMGFAVFPLAVSSAYGILFDVPTITVGYNYFYAGIGIAISVGVTVLSTYAAAQQSLKIHPSILMKPRAPKGGKRIALERLTPLWNRMSFNSKVTFRNVFRNKKRFFMAVLGVMGCTSLMVAGFGLRNSTGETLLKQFEAEDRIWRYDMQIVMNGSADATLGEVKAASIVASRSEIGVSMLECMKVYDASAPGGSEFLETYVLCPENESLIQNFINIRNLSGEPLNLSASGCIITQKLAQSLKLSVGDSICVNLNDGYQITIPVAEIAENYCFHYIYISKDAYKTYFGVNPKYNYIAANFAAPLSPEQKVALSTELMSEYEISAVSYAEDIKGLFENTLDSINYIVIILVVSAGILSLIVMYNLSVLNINERVKEIATIKVLGFNHKETRNYIFRENLILSSLGTFLGLFLGVAAHRGVVIVGEVDILRFGRSVGWWAFIAAAVLSMLFSLLVNLVLTRAINDVDMVESLKSNE